MNPKDKRTNEEIAREIVARFDTDKEMVVGAYFYDPLRKWIAEALDAKDTELQALREKVDQLSKENLELKEHVAGSGCKFYEVAEKRKAEIKELLSLIEVTRGALEVLEQLVFEKKIIATNKSGFQGLKILKDALSSPLLTHIVEVNRAKDEVIWASRKCYLSSWMTGFGDLKEALDNLTTKQGDRG